MTLLLMVMLVDAERDGHPIFATPADVRAYSVDVGDLSGITQEQADKRYDAASWHDMTGQLGPGGGGRY